MDHSKLTFKRLDETKTNLNFQAHPCSTPLVSLCMCNHLTLFGSNLHVPMNRIDLSNSAFLRLDENPVIFCALLGIVGLYMAAVVWARKIDRLDVNKVRFVGVYV